MASAVVEVALSWAVTTSLSFAVVLLDERRATEDQLERAWPPSSRNAALVAFGPLAIPVHFIKTRGHFRSLWGLAGLAYGSALGAAALALVLVASSGVLSLCAWVLGWPDG